MSARPVVAPDATEARVAELLGTFPPEDRRRLWRMPEVERLLGVSRSTIGRYVEHGQLACVKFPGTVREKTGMTGSVRFHLADVLRFVALHELASAEGRR